MGEERVGCTRSKARLPRRSRGRSFLQTKPPPDWGCGLMQEKRRAAKLRRAPAPRKAAADARGDATVRGQRETRTHEPGTDDRSRTVDGGANRSRTIRMERRRDERDDREAKATMARHTNMGPRRLKTAAQERPGAQGQCMHSLPEYLYTPTRTHNNQPTPNTDPFRTPPHLLPVHNPCRHIRGRSHSPIYSERTCGRHGSEAALGVC